MHEPGTEIHGRYTLVRLLGTGMGGETWLARDRSGEELAIKLLASNSRQARSDLLREAHVLQGILHENIVRYRGIVDLPGDDTCLFMDFVAGGDLERWMHRGHTGGLAVPDAARLLAQVVSALEALHEAGVLHRDLKPKNVLVKEAEPGALPKLLVADFGISKHTTQGMSGETRPVGTPGYMAPEQYRSRTLTFSADLHALGGVAWFLATGEHPPEAGDLAPLAAKVESAPERTRARSYWALVYRLRQQDPSGRGTLDEARRTLDPLASDGPWTGEDLGPVGAGDTVDIDLMGGIPATLERPEPPKPPAPEPPPRGLPAWATGAFAGVAAALAFLLAAPFVWPSGGPGQPGRVEPELVTGPEAIPEAPPELPPELPPETPPQPDGAGALTPPQPEPAAPHEPAREALVAPSAGPTGLLTVYAQGADATDVTVHVDGAAVARCEGCRGEKVLRALSLPVGTHTVQCFSSTGKDATAIEVDVREGKEEAAWCAPVWPL